MSTTSLAVSTPGPRRSIRLYLAISATLLAALAIGGCPADDGDTCNADADCSTGSICIDGTCGAVTATSRRAIDMVSVPAGAFTMGCDPGVDADCGTVEQPQHTVTTGAYRIERTEVSARDFADFLSQQTDNTCGDGKCVWTSRDTMPLESSDEVTWTPKAGQANRPMVQVRWHGANAFCQWRGLTLCSEAQWEKAARGGCEIHGGDCTTPRYPWGDTAADCTKAHMDDGGGPGCGTDAPAAVDGLGAGASPYGALNMAGNVWEWVADWHHDSYDGAPTDGSAWNDPATNWKVYKGGGARSDAQFLRGATRANGGPDDGNEYRGFRCCTAQ